MREPQLIIQQVDPETGRSRPASVTVLPEPITSAEAGLMVGSPPPPELRVSRSNWMAYPHSRWSFRHMEELGPSSLIGRGEGPVWELERSEPDETGLDLSGFEIEDDGGGAWTLDEFLHRTYTDAFLIAHRGKVVHEHYVDGMTPVSRHAMFSTTKTFTGLLAMLAIHDGQLGLDDLLVVHVPEFAGTAWEPVTVRHALDMTDGIMFEEDYADPSSEIMRYGVAMGFIPGLRDWEGPHGIHEALCSFTERATGPGEVFLYKSVTTDALAWATARATGRRWADSIAERIWQPLGAETDAGISLDPKGLEISSGGMFATAPDLLRFGMMIADGGTTGAGTRVLPSQLVADLVEGGEPGEGHLGGYATRAGWSFHRQCWNQYRLLGALMPMGVHGQRLFIHPEKKLVVLKLGSHPVTGNVFTDVVHDRFFRNLLERC